jgi:hypothetical protein
MANDVYIFLGICIHHPNKTTYKFFNDRPRVVYNVQNYLSAPYYINITPNKMAHEEVTKVLSYVFPRDGDNRFRSCVFSMLMELDSVYDTKSDKNWYRFIISSNIRLLTYEKYQEDEIYKILDIMMSKLTIWDIEKYEQLVFMNNEENRKNPPLKPRFVFDCDSWDHMLYCCIKADEKEKEKEKRKADEEEKE